MTSLYDAEREIPFAASFPLPFRVLFLTGLGILGWATNMHALDWLGVDVVGAMELRLHELHQPMSPLPPLRAIGSKFMFDSSTLYVPIYRLLVIFTIWCSASWILFRYLTRDHIFLVDVFNYIPGTAALIVLVALLCPFDIFQRRERDKFLHSVRRCLSSPLDRPIYFADIVFADILTSYAKVLGDVWLSVVMLLPGSSLLVPPAQQGWLRWILPTVMSLPYLTRLRQCLIEYALPTNESRKPLFNALKYATSFPVIFLSAAQRIVVSQLMEEKGESVSQRAWHGEHRLFRLWLLAAVVNSLYSFWWDVTNDWGLDIFTRHPTTEARIAPRPLVLPVIHSRSSSVFHLHITPQTSESLPSFGIPAVPNENTSHHRSKPWGLRPTLLYPPPVYPLLIFLNLVLRLTWSIKLSSHLHSSSDGSVIIFWLEIAELTRRWIWVFIRVEWEAVKKMHDDESRRRLEAVNRGDD